MRLVCPGKRRGHGSLAAALGTLQPQHDPQVLGKMLSSTAGTVKGEDSPARGLKSNLGLGKAVRMDKTPENLPSRKEKRN